MSEKAKILADDEEVLLDISELESMIPEYLAHQSDELEQAVLKLFAPHAHSAKNQYEERKSRQMSRQKWLQTIVNNQVNLQMAQANIRNFAEKAKQTAKNNGGVTI